MSPFGFSSPAPSDALALKAGEDAPGSQRRIDRLAAAAIKASAGTWTKAFAPVLKLVEKAGSLEELKEMMEDDATVAALYKEMDVSDVEQLLQKVMTYADLEGRALENARD